MKHPNSSREKPWPLKARGERKKRLCRHMVNIWNRTVHHKLYPETKTSLTSRREETFIWFLEEILGFERSWEAYCKLIANHGFLGKVTLDWALAPDNAYRIWGVVSDESPGSSSAFKDMPWPDFYEKIRRKCQRHACGAQWFQICQNLAKRVGQKVYTVWFAEASLAEFRDNTLVIQVSSAFKRDYILAYFFLDVVYAAQAVYPSINRIDFRVGP